MDDAAATSDGEPWRIGETAPWSVAWSGEQAFRLQPSRDFPGMEHLAAKIPAGREVVLSCHRLYGAAFTRKVARRRAAWEAAVRARRAQDAPTGS